MVAPAQPELPASGPLWVRWLSCLVLFGLCGWGLFGHALHPRVLTNPTPEPPRSSLASVLNGGFFGDWSLWLKESAWLTYQMRGLYNETRLRLGILDPGLVEIAPGGWMYLKAHIAGVPGRQAARRGDRVRHARAISALCERMGVTLLTAVVPAKPLVHPEAAYGLDHPPPERLAIHRALVQDLRDGGLEVLDLQRSLRDAATAGKRPFYLRDVHWNTHGADVAAQIILLQLDQIGGLAGGPVPGRVVRLVQMAEGYHMPDLVKMLGVRSTVALGRPSPHGVVLELQEQGQLPVLQVRQPGPAGPVAFPPRRESPDAPYALVGDSFGLTLAPLLCWRLGDEVHQGFTKGAARPPQPLYDCLREIHAGKLSARVVIWEFLERHGGAIEWAEPVPNWVAGLLSSPR